MGGNQSRPKQVGEQETPKINHPRITNPKFLKGKDGENIIQINVPVVNQTQYNQWATALKKGPKDKEPFLLPNSHSFKKEGLCGSSGFATIQYDGFPFLLADEIINRETLKNKFFDEPELWYLIYTLLTAGHLFHEDGRKIGDVRPQNIFINEDGQVKVATQLTWPSEGTNYQRTFYDKETTYLAPEQLKDILFAKMEPSGDERLAQSFSIGLTCLDAGTLGNSNSLYLKGNKFDYEGLENRLKDLENVKYSDLLSATVRNLCEVDPERRSTCSELFRWLNPFEEYIVNLERFEVNGLPEKLENSRKNYSPHRTTTQMVSAQQSQPQYQTESPPHQYQQPRPEQTVTYVQRPPSIQEKPPIQEYRQSTTVTGIPPEYINQGVRMQSQPFPPTYGPPQTYTRTYVNEQQQQQQQQRQSNGPVTYQQFTSSSYTPVNNAISSDVAFQQQQQAQQQQAQLVQQQNANRTTYTTQTFTSNNNVENGGENSSPERQGNVGRSNMQMTLEKIDEQLQMSRKMFPS